MKILVTGGTGYIGSHTCVALIEDNYEVLILDNLSNSSQRVLNRLKTITGKPVDFEKADIRDRAALDRTFSRFKPDAVIHFAGLKAVGESVSVPLRYYDNNVTGTITLLAAMAAAGVGTMVFSSSATVYGDPPSNPIREDFPIGPTNPYGRTKLIIEQILSDCHAADIISHITLLRYFNPVGAHPSGLIGEHPSGIPNNLTPYIARVAAGRLEELPVFGDDYDTRDGTGVRDYIHVMDLAAGHLKALETARGLSVYNLGTGTGYSVLEMIRAFEKASGNPVSYRICPRRPGDIAECYADPSRAEKELGWKAVLGIDDMTRDAWRWQSANPEGYQGEKHQYE
ncbi:MAG: UDP-glucose 4-epimerase GalE [Thermodesulfobacteriota bacterium]|nr:UDP-glucose 4-epimerase GalE [Thermodesulfobacteriota bacterium]